MAHALLKKIVQLLFNFQFVQLLNAGEISDAKQVAVFVVEREN
jgi:hypothetical protein